MLTLKSGSFGANEHQMKIYFLEYFARRKWKPICLPAELAFNIHYFSRKLMKAICASGFKIEGRMETDWKAFKYELVMQGRSDSPINRLTFPPDRRSLSSNERERMRSFMYFKITLPDEWRSREKCLRNVCANTYGKFSLRSWPQHLIESKWAQEELPLGKLQVHSH